MSITAERAAEIEACMEVLVKQALAMEAARDAGDEAEAYRVGLEAANSLLTWTPIEHGAMTIALALGVGKLTEEKDELESKHAAEVAAFEAVIASYASKQISTFNEDKDNANA